MDTAFWPAFSSKAAGMVSALSQYADSRSRAGRRLVEGPHSTAPERPQPESGWKHVRRLYGFAGRSDTRSGLLTGGNIPKARTLILLSGLKLEMKGLNRSRNLKSCYSIIKDEFNLKGNKEKVYNQFKELLIKEGLI